MVKVWDLMVRTLHWILVLSVIVTWLTEHGPAALHDGAGYLALAIIAIRLVWGFCGSKYARFRQFVTPPVETWYYAKQVVAAREPRYLGHNPLGAWMVVALLASATTAAVTGWLYTTDAFWGVAWMEALHDTAADLLLILAMLHVAGVIFTSIRQRKNLVAAMLNGRKRKDW